MSHRERGEVVSDNAKTVRRYRDGALVEIPMRFRVYANTPSDLEKAVAHLMNNGVHMDCAVAGNNGRGRGYSYSIQAVKPGRQR